MSREYSSPGQNVNEEIAALIETLHDTEQRLDELTGGAVDSVTDRSGRTLLLRLAHDQLRCSEAAKQAALIDSLPAPIALLDGQGLIVVVNDAWRQFGRENLLQSPDFCVGLNYLEICDSAQDAPEARQVAAGIRSVLLGRAKSFSFEYSCHSPAEQRWFVLTASPLPNDRLIGAVIMHHNISDRKRSEEEQRSVSQLLASIIDNIPTAVQLKSVQNDFRIQIWNKAAEALYGLPRQDAIGRNVHDLWPKFDADRMHASDLELMDNRNLQDFPDRAVLTVDRGTVSAHMRKIALSDASGTATHLLVIADDITERKAAEARMIHLSRVYAMLSGINNLIVRATSRDELFKEACAIAVEAGGFRMSLIAIVDPSTTRIVPVASTGKDEALLADIQELLASAEGARSTMVAKAIRDKEIAVANDSLNDPRLVFGGKYAEAGVRSMAIFPLIVSNVAVGVFTMYASEIEFFREEELKLLADLAGDIAFAIDHIDKQERLNYLAYYDVLTGLPNRTLLDDRLEQGTRAARRNDGLLAVMSVDLDNFKAVNDTLGHTVGDALLREVANRLVSCVRDTDTVGRLGGDEFLILLPEIGSSEDAAMVARKLIESCARPYLIAGHELFVSASIGITLFPTDAAESETLIRNADTAMYRAKELGRNTYQFFTAEMNRNTQEKLDLERDLRHALSRGEFLIHYQPKVSCTTGKITGFEALLRWQHPLRGLVGPVAFIPLLEESRLIVAVGEWVLTNACIQAQRWHDTGLGTPSIAVNISGRQIEAGDLCETVKVALATSGLAPAFLELELTESQLMKDAVDSIALLQRVKAMGVKISIDDFGTGFSSLAYLKRFPIDCLKVDRAFVKDIIADTNDVSITRAIITLAHNLKLKVVAEGVETEGQLGLLIANQCDEVQGYYFSRPLGAEDATALLRTRQSLDSRMIASMQRSRTLLLVDDEENIISSLKRLLRQDGYTILTASGAEQGLELLATHSVDVVVSDQRMPGIGGIEFLRRIKTLHPHTVRLVLSGYTDLQAVTDAVNDGAIYKFLTKPWDDGILRAQIKEAFLKKETADENRHTGPPNMFEDIGVIQDVINAIPAAIFAKDATSRFVLVNKACESQWGMSASDLRGTDGSQVFPADQVASFLAKDKEIFARGYLLDYEETYWNAELKQNRFGHTFKKPVFDAAGNPLYLVCVTVDITERRLATDKLLRSEEKLREVAPGKRTP
ncbi:EAL domain-containing protein [Rhodoferax sp. U2-2l]|uniref:EAL domain-containing protein n=1 Tax=Rhodoferax sp. U2-2l TaxID=2884000 RepID=UPI001D0B8105|nr:EAL domain-containing protein [Rhodoferax sp. U2-2l]MCB8746004.1 EAL domain-containing protein [Rhodoferax sp. U2-2l]